MSEVSITLSQQQLNKFFEIINASKLYTELVELTQITDATNFMGIQKGTDDAKKVSVPNVRGILGTWDASSNTPSLADGVGIEGDSYYVNAAGTVNFGSGSYDFIIGDYVKYIEGEWRKVPTVTKTSDILNDSETGNNFFASHVTISGADFILFKAPANRGNLATREVLETNDVVMGYDPSGNFLMAKYLGGTTSDFTNDAVYEKFGGF